MTRSSTSLTSFATAFLTGARHFWFAPTCPVCDSELLEAGLVCSTCEEDLLSSALSNLEQDSTQFMSHSGQNIERMIWYSHHLSLFGWNAAWQKFLYSWKYGNQRKLYKFFLNTLEIWAPSMLKFGFDHLTIIDSGRGSRRRRGYQPCLDLAPVLARALGIGSGLNIFKKATRVQSSQNYRERFFEMHGALACRSDTRISGKHILLFEDVFTTGATANEAARLLLLNGADQVSVCSLVYREDAVLEPSGVASLNKS